VYGSTPVAGVVNFITRKNVEGVEASFQYNQTSRTTARARSRVMLGTHTRQAELTFGGKLYPAERRVGGQPRPFPRILSGCTRARSSSAARAERRAAHFFNKTGPDAATQLALRASTAARASRE